VARPPPPPLMAPGLGESDHPENVVGNPIGATGLSLCAPPVAGGPTPAARPASRLAGGGLIRLALLALLLTTQLAFPQLFDQALNRQPRGALRRRTAALGSVLEQAPTTLRLRQPRATCSWHGLAALEAAIADSAKAIELSQASLDPHLNGHRRRGPSASGAGGKPIPLGPARDPGGGLPPSTTWQCCQGSLQQWEEAGRALRRRRRPARFPCRSKRRAGAFPAG